MILAALQGPVERSVATQVALVGVGPVLEQAGDFFQVTPVGGSVQGVPTAVIALHLFRLARPAVADQHVPEQLQLLRGDVGDLVAQVEGSQGAPRRQLAGQGRHLRAAEVGRHPFGLKAGARVPDQRYVVGLAKRLEQAAPAETGVGVQFQDVSAQIGP